LLSSTFLRTRLTDRLEQDLSPCTSSIIILYFFVLPHANSLQVETALPGSPGCRQVGTKEQKQ